ncbi:hypothetical protein B0H11DRAFT_2237645 [Mycena galericulata]|nr:hypothetical protein B0H11DRAFT_2237645 [Mycena galericulata]
MDDTAPISHFEIASMLDSLGTTLTASTADSFFARFWKAPRRDDLTVEAICCLETEVLLPESECRHVDEEGSGSAGMGTSISPSPAPETATPGQLRLAEMDFVGPSLRDAVLA